MPFSKLVIHENSLNPAPIIPQLIDLPKPNPNFFSRIALDFCHSSSIETLYEEMRKDSNFTVAMQLCNLSMDFHSAIEKKAATTKKTPQKFEKNKNKEKRIAKKHRRQQKKGST